MNLIAFGLGFIIGGILQLVLIPNSRWTYVWYCIGAFLILVDFLSLFKRKPVDPNAPLCPQCARRMKENPEVQKAIIMTYFIKTGHRAFNCPGCGVELKLMYRKVDGR